jgi:hypothetical protein
MYLTAQHVRSPRGTEGINSALYRHEAHELPEGFWEAPDISYVAEQVPGERTAATQIEVAPGGNRVVSYLDIAAPEGTEQAAIVAALDVAERNLSRALPCSVVLGHVAVRFSLDPGDAPRALTEFQELRRRALALYADRQPPAWAALEPLTIEVGQADEGWTFQLSAESAPRVRAVLGPEGKTARVSIPLDAATTFRRIHGPLYPHVAEWVTNLSREQLLELGGVRFVDSDKILWEWPQKPGE